MQGFDHSEGIRIFDDPYLSDTWNVLAQGILLKNNTIDLITYNFIETKNSVKISQGFICEIPGHCNIYQLFMKDK